MRSPALLTFNTVASEASSTGGASDEPPRQGVLLWEIPDHQELPQATQQRCRELLTHLLLAAVSTDPNQLLIGGALR